VKFKHSVSMFVIPAQAGIRISACGGFRNDESRLESRSHRFGRGHGKNSNLLLLHALC